MTIKRLPGRERLDALIKAQLEGKITPIFLDTETSLMEVYTHYIGQQVNINHQQIKKPSKLITIQFKVAGEETVTVLDWGKKQDDRSMLEKFIRELKKYPNILLIGQNHKAFDNKWINKRIKDHQLEPLDLYNMFHIDTLTASRSSFREPSHKLDYRSALYGLGGKEKMEFQDWVDIGNGDKKKLKKMISYGTKDVNDLEDIFWHELPYYSSLPAPLDKILRDTIIKCLRCEGNKKPKYNVEIVGKKAICKVCNEHWRI